MEPNKLQKIQITQKEIWQASRPLIHKNKKNYTRKEKHKSAWRSGSSFVYLYN